MPNAPVSEKVNSDLARAIAGEPKSERLIILQIFGPPWTFFDMHPENNLQVSSCSLHVAVQIRSL